MFLDQLTSRSC